MQHEVEKSSGEEKMKERHKKEWTKDTKHNTSHINT